MTEWDSWQQKRHAIRQKNKELIAYWRSIPWYQWYKKPSFEEQRAIIIDNWHSLQSQPLGNITQDTI